MMWHLQKFYAYILKDYKEESLKATATRIAEQALELSYDSDYMSPFAEQAKEHGYHVTGAVYNAGAFYNRRGSDLRRETVSLLRLTQRLPTELEMIMFHNRCG